MQLLSSLTIINLKSHLENSSKTSSRTKWFGISGSWRKINQQIESDTRNSVRSIIKQGNGVVTGGALGVDYIATDEVLKLNPSADLLKIFLPVKLDIYEAHYRKRAEEGVITHKQAEDLISQLKKVKALSSSSIIENINNIEVNTITYNQRSSQVVNNSDELIAFQVNKSLGVQDAIDKAYKKRIPVKIFSYTIAY